MKWEYLIFNLLVVTGSTLAAGYYRGGKLPKFRKALGAIFTVGGGFVVWDMLVTNWWWSFNPKFVLGWKIGGLPLEEICFFGSVPWACLVVWENIKYRIGGEWKWGKLRWAILVILAMISVGTIINGRWYLAMVSGLGAVIILLAGEKIARSTLLLAMIVTGLNLVFNGYLTGRPVVIYNPQVISGIRVGSVPVEDLIYGWILVWGVTKLYERNGKMDKDLGYDQSG